MKSSVQAPSICRHVAVVLTVPGREALLRRAIESIAAQTHAPVRVIIVPDGNDVFAESTKHLAAAIVPNVEIVKNRRTKNSLSGAANTAMDHLLRTETATNNVLVSFLDDDDRWDSEYLGEIRRVANDFDGFFAGAIVRYDDKTPEGRQIPPPKTITVDDFLAGNPGIQGSSLSVSLESLLLAGGFDEALSSCNDRDLVIRLLDLGRPYRAVPKAIAHHDTLHGTPRLSDRASAPKCRGLDVFFLKYQWRMSPTVREAFMTRAQTFFDWTIPADVSVPAAIPIVTPTIPVQSRNLHLVVGFIVDGHRADRAKPLVDGLAKLAKHAAINRLDVVMLENGDALGYADVLKHAQTHGLRGWSVSMSDQLAAAEALGLEPTDVSRNKAIAIARTLLQRFVHEVARQTPKTIAWILDDDVRLSIEPDHLVDMIARLQSAEYDVVMGSVSGAPPVPAATTSRTQLLDIASFLMGAAKHDPVDSVPDAEKVNARWRIGRRDYYYDLARSETDRLETPFVPPLVATTVTDAIEELALRVPRVFAGEAVTRSVLAATGDVVADARPSRIRGGNTLVYRIDLLRDLPNLSPRLDGRPIRRSDMLWAANASLRLGYRVVSAPFSLEQDRSADAPQNDSVRSVLDDVLGYAFFRAYEEVLCARSMRSTDLLTSDEAKTILKRTKKYAVERFMAFRLSFWRARGLAAVLRRCVFGDRSFRPWWLDDARCGNTVARWREFVMALEDRLSSGKLEQFEVAFDEALRSAAFETFLEKQEQWLSLPANFPIPSISQWYVQERIRRATTLVQLRLSREITEVLGYGGEGVVLRSRERIIKVFDGWSRSDCEEFVPTLQSLVKTPRISGLPEFVAFHQWPESVALETVYEPSTPYEGGRGPELFECLRSLIAAGWVHTNIHPKNLRVTANGVQIIDVGRSLQKYEQLAEERMVRRAFLSWRFAFRTDLATLLRRSITECDFTELTGWRKMLAAFRLAHPKQRLDELIEKRVERPAPRHLFDYGCGKPRAIHERTVTNAELEVFDLDDGLRARWSKNLSSVRFHDAASIKKTNTQFDVVVCALVLCTIDDSAAKRVLIELRRLVRPDGRVLIAVCDPTSIHVQHTTQQTRLNTTQIGYNEHAKYDKCVASSCRHEEHRPLETYRRMFARVGLRVENENIVHGVDIDRFEEVGEFILFELSPLPSLPVSASLLVKVCAMEADTIAHQMRHLVRALGTPRGFDEIVVVVDPFMGPFPRQYQKGDVRALRETLQELQVAGVIDRIVEGPLDGTECRPIALRWFGHEATKAHAKNGQALLAFLAALDACTGDLVLHADADVLVGRPDAAFDHIAEVVCLFETISDLVTLALPVFGDEDPNPRFADERGPFRVETQIGWLHKARLFELRPLPNEVNDGQLELPWHRSLDRMVRAGKASSARRGASGIWYTSPDNTRKVVLNDLFMLLDRVEAGQAPAIQRHNAATMGTFEQWLTPKRNEPVVVIACGRNVGPGRITRFRESLLRQTFTQWGAIIIDDASDDGSDEVLHRVFADERARTTLIYRRRRMGALANLVFAIKFFIERPDAIVVLIDLDDALGTSDALAKVVEAYDAGADMTVGTMIRTDKQIDYPVDFDDPRGNRGGNVWQHLRTFRKYLFERIAPADLQIDGAWIELASDWAFMLPIVEMAEKPTWIRTPIYLHEPGDPRGSEHRDMRENMIARLVAKPRYSRRGPRSEEKS